MTTRRHRLIMATSFAGLLTLASGLLFTFGYGGGPGVTAVMNAIAILQLPATLVSMMLAGNVHGGGEVAYFVAVFLQWFLAGYGVAVVFTAGRGSDGDDRHDRGP